MIILIIIILLTGVSCYFLGRESIREENKYFKNQLEKTWERNKEII